MSGVNWGAGRECRYSGARRGMGGIRGQLRAPRGLGPSGVYWGLGGSVGIQGPEGM